MDRNNKKKDRGKKENYKVYIHISPSNKKYIGITKTSLKQRWGKDGIGYQFQIKFYNAIQKYGWSNFEHKLIKENLSKEEAEFLEKDLIKKYDSINNGYNILEGGLDAFDFYNSSLPFSKKDLIDFQEEGCTGKFLYECYLENDKFMSSNYIFLYFNNVIIDYDISIISIVKRINKNLKWLAMVYKIDVSKRKTYITIEEAKEVLQKNKEQICGYRFVYKKDRNIEDYPSMTYQEELSQGKEEKLTEEEINLIFPIIK